MKKCLYNGSEQALFVEIYKNKQIKSLKACKALWRKGRDQR